MIIPLYTLLTTLIVRKFGFNEYAVSSAGAQGLMQLMHDTAKDLCVTNPFASTVSIAVASYNGERGHIKDAQQIAIHQFNDPNQWENIKASLGLLTEKTRNCMLKYGSQIPHHTAPLTGITRHGTM